MSATDSDNTGMGEIPWSPPGPLNLPPWGAPAIPPPMWTWIREQQRKRARGPDLPPGEKVGEGYRHRYLLRQGGAMHERGMSEGAILAALLEENRQRCSPPKEEELVRDLVRDISTRYARGDLGPTLIISGAATSGEAPNINQIIDKAINTLEYCSHDALLDMDLPPLRWIVKGLVADEGMSVLGGKKKLGKSWLCLQIAQAVATGQSCLGLETMQGPVVYIVLEDGRRRLKDRLLKQQALRGLPIHYYTRLPPLDGEGLPRLIEILDKHRPRLLILDTLAAAKSGKLEENAAGPMADLGNKLRALAQYFHLGILPVHHHGKLIGGDPGDDLRGSSALAAAADVNLGIYKTETGFVIRSEGRDIERGTIEVGFGAYESWKWEVRTAVNATNAARQNEARERVLEALAALGPSDANGVAAYLEISHRAALTQLQNLAAENLVQPRIVAAEGRGRPRAVFHLPETTCDDPFDGE